MHYVRAWKFKSSPIFITVVIVAVSLTLGLLVADISGLINLGNFGIAIGMLLISLIPVFVFACFTIGKYEEVKVEKIAEFEVDRMWEVKYYWWIYLLFAVVCTVLGLTASMIFFVLFVNVALLILLASKQKFKILVTDRGVYFQGFLIEWDEIKDVKIVDKYVILYKNPVRVVAIPKEALNIVDKFLQNFFDSRL